MNRKPLAAAVAVAALSAVALQSADAHTPKLTESCKDGGAQLVVDLTQYEPGSTVTVTSELFAYGTFSFQADFHRVFELGDPRLTHSYVVVIDNAGQKTEAFDQTLEGTTKYCQDTPLTPPTTTTTGAPPSPSTTTTQPSTPPKLPTPTPPSVQPATPVIKNPAFTG